MGATTGDVVNEHVSAPTRNRMRALGQRLGLSPQAPADHLYHGFISYSHAADGKLAPALQRGLQRFAKPWYRMRALHVFRDEAAMSANPHLWGSVKDALDASQYYILLASPRAAASEWVAREASYWREHKSTDTILIGLTDGELFFNQDAAGANDNALPAPLRDAFTDEPRYIDLRWVQNANPGDLSISHPQFRDAIAELAAPLHGKPKEELASEEVRQHRRTLRVARSAAATLLTLLALAVVAALIAYSQYQSAQSRSLAAQATANLTINPQRSLTLALQSTQIETGGTAVQALRLALAQAPLRMTIDSGAGNAAHAAWNPVLNQIAVSGPNDTVALWNPRTGRVERVLRGPPSPTPSLFTSSGPLLYSPDGQWIAYVDGAGTVSVWNAVTGVAVSTGGLAQAIAAAKIEQFARTRITWANQREVLLVSGLGLDRVFEFNPSAGTVGTLVNLPGDEQMLVPSPDGSKLLIAYATRSGGDGASVLDLASRTFVPMPALPPRTGLQDHEACWLPGGDSFVTWAPTEAQDLVLRVWNATTGKQTSAIPLSATVSAAACGGTARQPWLGTGDYGGAAVLRVFGGLAYGLNGHSDIINAAASSPGGAYLATGSNDGTARIWDGQSGEFIRVLPDGSPVNTVQFSPDSGLALTTDQRGLVKIWDIGVGEPSTAFASAGAGHAYPLGYVQSGSRVYGLNASVNSGTLSSADLVTWNSASGAVVGRVPLPVDITTVKVPCTGVMNSIEFCDLTPPPSLVTHVPTAGGSVTVALAVNADATRIAYSQPGAVTVLDGAGHPVARLPVSGAITGLAFAKGSNTVLVMTNAALLIWTPGRPATQIRQANPPIDAQLNANGSTVAAAQIDGTVGVWSAATGRSLALLHPSAAIKPPFAPGSRPIPLRVALSPDGSTVAAGTTWQTVSLWSVTSGQLIAVRTVSTPRDYQGGGFGGSGPWPIAQLGFSDDGSRLLAVDFPQIGAGDSEPPGAATVLDSATGAVVAALQSPGPNGASISPGVGLSSDGTFIFSGVLGFAPTPPGGNQAAYQVGGQGGLGLNLQNAGLPPLATAFDAPVPADPWSPDGIDLLAGARGIYTCDACGSVSELQDAAARRAAWQQPLSVGHDTPPSGNPYR